MRHNKTTSQTKHRQNQAKRPIGKEGKVKFPKEETLDLDKEYFGDILTEREVLHRIMEGVVHAERRW